MTESDIAPLDPKDTGRTVTVDGLTIHYNVVESGRGSGTPVVFTHGGGPGSSGWNNFLYNARAISKRHTCYFYDMPGFGSSDCIPVKGPVHSWHAEIFVKFLEAINVQKAHLINQSFGGSMAIKVAAMAPDRVDHLVLTGSRPVIGGMLTPINMARSREAMKSYYDDPSIEKMRQLIADLEFYEKDKITDINVNSRHEISTKPEVWDFMADPANRGSPESLIDEFRNVKCPTLIIHGLHDVFGAVDVPLFMVNQFADARLHIVGNAAHHVQTECPTEYNAVVLAFIP